MGRKKTQLYTSPRVGTQEEKIARMCSMLELTGFASSFKNVAERVNHDQGTIHDFIENLLEKEIHYREENRIINWIQQARFPFQKTIEQFDFKYQPSIDQRLVNELSSCRFIGNGENVIFLGPPGVGKTHLSIGLGLEAIQQGFDAKFVKLDEFIDRVERERMEHESEPNFASKVFKLYVRPRLLILDDIDFYDTGKDVSTVLFKLICQRYEKKLSTIFTSNKLFSDWGGLFGSKERAGAALDRIIENASIISIKGHSYRVRDKVKLKQVAAVA
ncbi:MAG: ATP-binding protein [Candidatus Vogelbacteria bacterium]|nr:ATP-binding protein [Candidatus Vogelbacteria bacterium]